MGQTGTIEKPKDPESPPKPPDNNTSTLENVTIPTVVESQLEGIYTDESMTDNLLIKDTEKRTIQPGATLFLKQSVIPKNQTTLPPSLKLQCKQAVFICNERKITVPILKTLCPQVGTVVVQVEMPNEKNLKLNDCKWEVETDIFTDDNSASIACTKANPSVTFKVKEIETCGKIFNCTISLWAFICFLIAGIILVGIVIVLCVCKCNQNYQPVNNSTTQQSKIEMQPQRI